MKKVLISGASIAGPALGYWLHRYGFETTIVERAPALRPGGYAVDLRGTAVTVAQKMGIFNAIKQAQTHMGAVAYVDAQSRAQATLPAELFSGEIEILRGDLSRILYDSTSHHVEYRFGDSISAIEEMSDGVSVRFESGKQQEFDIVIGADGLHSHVRRLAFGEESAYMRRLGYYVALFSLENYLKLDHTGMYYNEPKRLAAIYSVRQNHKAIGSFFFAAPPQTYDYHNREEQQAIVATQYRNARWEVPRLLEAMRNAPDFYFDSVSQIHMDRWSRGRIALLGDAAYCASPLSGMGTGLALIGAYVLAGELNATNDHHLAFARYEQHMRPFVKECQQFGQDGGKWFVPESRFMIWFRNQNLRLLPYLPWKKLFTEAPLKVANAISLGSYEAAL